MINSFPFQCQLIFLLLPKKVWFPKKIIPLESTSLSLVWVLLLKSNRFCEAPFSLRYSYRRTQIVHDLITWLCTALSFGTYVPVLLFSTWYKLLCGWHAQNISAAESKQKCQSSGVLKKLLWFKFLYSWNVWNSDELPVYFPMQKNTSVELWRRYETNFTKEHWP